MSENAMGNIRVGVVGLKRGSTFVNIVNKCGMELVAVCDIEEDLAHDIGERYNVTAYTEYDKFLEHDLDAVILTNYFHEHAPFAIKALKAGKHVMSEVSACRTMAQGVELVRTVEETGKIYMMAENYPYFCYNQEMRRLYQANEVGELQYGEGEYVHPCSSADFNRIAPGMNHWRNQKPATYYCTHSLGPIMYITDTRPTSVNALCIPFSDKDKEMLHVRRHDIAATIMCHMNNGAVVVLNGVSLRGGGDWYRIHGTRGLMENMRTGNKNMLRVVHNSWDMNEEDVSERIYLPEFKELRNEAKAAGHGGSDFFTTYNFAEAIRENRQPYHNVYRGLDMTLVGIQAYKSALQNGAPFEVPDFREQSVRKQYENDNWSPFVEDSAPGQPCQSIKGNIVPGKEAVEYAEKIWKENRYR